VRENLLVHRSSTERATATTKTIDGHVSSLGYSTATRVTSSRPGPPVQICETCPNIHFLF
jgi:hypothetical protein